MDKATPTPAFLTRTTTNQPAAAAIRPAHT
jgi:hypothetical protein